MHKLEHIKSETGHGELTDAGWFQLGHFEPDQDVECVWVMTPEDLERNTSCQPDDKEPNEASASVVAVLGDRWLVLYNEACWVVDLRTGDSGDLDVANFNGSVMGYGGAGDDLLELARAGRLVMAGHGVLEVE